MGLTPNQFASLPTSALKDITAQPTQPSAGSATGAGGAPDIFSTGNHTQATPGASAPDPTAQKKTITDLMGNKAGKFAASLMDLILPAVICFIVSKLGRKSTLSDWKLAQDEEELIIPAWQAILDKMVIDLNNPWVQFAIVFGSIYGSKVVYKWEKLDKNPKKENSKATEVLESLKEVSKTVVTDIKNAKSFDEEYKQQYDLLVEQVRKEKKKGVDNAKKYIKEMGLDKKLAEKIRQQPKNAA